MALTQPQLAALKAYIDSVPVLAAYPLNGDGPSELTARLNTEAVTPPFLVWRESVSQAEIMNNGFDWVRVDNLSVGKARIWEWLFKSTNTINAAKANVRAGIEETWKGTAADLAVREAVYAHCREAASHIKKLFAVAATAPPVTSGTLGSVTNVAVASITAVTQSDVEAARSLA